MKGGLAVTSRRGQGPGRDGEREGRGPQLLEGTAPQELGMDCWRWSWGGREVENSGTLNPWRMLRVAATFCLAF